MDGSAADSVPHNTTTVVKSEMAFSPASVASNGHFPFTQSKISGLSVDASALDSTFTSDMTSSEGFQLGLDNGTGMKESLSLGSIPWNLSLSDLTADLPNFEGDTHLCEELFKNSVLCPSIANCLLNWVIYCFPILISNGHIPKLHMLLRITRWRFGVLIIMYELPIVVNLSYTFKLTRKF